VDLLDQRRRIRWGMQAQIAARPHLAAAPAGEADGDESSFPRSVDRPQNVR